MLCSQSIIKDNGLLHLINKSFEYMYKESVKEVKRLTRNAGPPGYLCESGAPITHPRRSKGLPSPSIRCLSRANTGSNFVCRDFKSEIKDSFVASSVELIFVYSYWFKQKMEMFAVFNSS